MMFGGLSLVRRLSFSALAALGLTLGACAGDDMGDSDTDPTTNPTSMTETMTSAPETDGTTTDTTDDTTTDDTTTDDTTTDDTTSGSTTATAVDYESDIQKIWDDNCVAGCHTPGGSKADYPLDPGDSYDTLVGNASAQALGMDLVTPNDTANSYVWHKLNDTQASGDVMGSGLKMPLGQMLDAAELSLIEDWINTGAES